jgi:hypothetical protein
MLASNDNSYAKEYARRRQARGGRRPGPGGAAGEMLLTDRGEYIKFLESQLDAVTQACLTAQSFDERIVAAGAAAASHDEKILNLARLIKCAQGVAEEQERAYHAAMERVHERVRRCEAAVARVADAENENVFRATKALRRKGLAHRVTGDPNVEPNKSSSIDDELHSRRQTTARDDGDHLSVGVLDAQFRAWADARERDVDARVVALERRLAARVDDGVAAVLDAVRKAERRLREESPRLAEHAARRLWTAAGAEDGLSRRGGDATEAETRSGSSPNTSGSFPFLEGGVASGGSVRALAERVEALETSEAELQATLRATRELQSTHAAEMREHRAREAARESRREADERARRAAEEATARANARARDDDARRRDALARRDAETAVRRERTRLSGDASERDCAFELSTDDADRDDKSSSEGAFFPGFFPGNDRARADAGAFESEALARSVEASARGFERLGNQLAELQRRLDSRDADVASLRAQVEKKMSSSVSYRGNVPGIDDRRPAAMILAEAAALRAARDSVERARGIRVSRSPPTSPAAKEKSASGVPDASGPKAGGPSEDVDHAALARIREETRSSLRGDADARDASMASEAEARREKLAGLYERLGAFSPSPKTE